MLRVAICDDEPLAVARLSHLLRARSDVQIIGVANDGDTAIEMALAKRPDAMLIDVEMPMCDGLDVAEQIKRQWVGGGKMPRIVFVTGHANFAVDAFDAGAVDYVMKPVRFGRLDLAIDRVISVIRGEVAINDDRETGGRLSGSADIIPKNNALWIRHGADRLCVDLSQVERISAEREYVRLFYDNHSYLHRARVTAIEALLNPGHFIRIHRSHILRCDQISAIRRTSSGEYQLITKAGKALPIGRSRRQSVRAVISHTSFDDPTVQGFCTAQD